MTVRTRDDEDTIGAHLAFHLSAGVDFVIANDHRSVDGTRDVLEEYERRGLVHLIRRDDEDFVPGIWVDEMARRAAVEFGADWVFHTDADEFWWPRGGNLKDVLETVPARFAVVRGIWRHFAARPDDDSHFAERMTVRLAGHGPWMDVQHTFHPNVKVAHRADPSIEVRRGNHDVSSRLPVLRSWLPFEVLHFPLRTLAQAARKYTAWMPVLDRGVYVASHVELAAGALRAGGFGSFYERYVVDEPRLEVGLAERNMSIDTRLRDALRLLSHDQDAPLPLGAAFSQPSGILEFPAFDVDQEALLADDAMSLADPVERSRRRMDGIDQRLGTLEQRSIRRVLSRR
jgi:hypothetical protein